MSLKKSTRKLKAAETKKRVYESAVALFKRKGFDQTSVDSIIEMAGVSKGTFYVHFESKVALMLEYIQGLDVDYENYVFSLFEELNNRSKLLLLTEKIADKMIDQVGIDLLKTIYEAQITKPVHVDAILDYNRRLYGLYKELLAQGVQQGEFKMGMDIDMFSNHCVISIRGFVYEWCVRYPQFNFKRELLQHFELLLDGIQN